MNLQKNDKLFRTKVPKIHAIFGEKKVWLGIVNDEGHLVVGCFFITFALIKNYGVNIYKDRDDDDIFFHYVAPKR